MFTVFIQPKHVMDSFQQFYPIMAEAIESGQASSCQWIEAGETVETAVPELYDIISNKAEWRAIIVCAEMDEGYTRYPTDVINPFDYLENKCRTELTVENGKIVDCEADLIRLTHLLGGIPAPEPQFTPHIDDVEGKVPKLVYHATKDSESTDAHNEAYKLWCEEHVFCGQMPREIILLKARRAISVDARTLVSEAWKTHNESQSSKFWKRNLYPPICRFLVYDLDRHAAIRQSRDLFRLWTALLLISVNNIDPDVLQANRLYKLDIVFDVSRLQNCFQQIAYRLNVARCRLLNSFKQEAEKGEINTSIPNYHLQIPVLLRLVNASDARFDTSSFGLMGGIISDDMLLWKEYIANTKQELDFAISSVDRVLDRAADVVHKQSSYALEEVCSLTQYQKEDMTASLALDYYDVLDEQRALPVSATAAKESLDAADNAVRDAIRRRISKTQGLFSIAMSASLIALSLLPGIIRSDYRPVKLLIYAGSISVIVIAGILVLIRQKKALLQYVQEFRYCIDGIMRGFVQNEFAFTDFLSSVASHMHGYSYLRIMQDKQRKRDNSYYYKKKHLKAIDSFLEKIEIWSAALHVKVDTGSVNVLESDEESTNQEDYDELYSLSMNKSFRIPLNQTGIYIKAPFDFVECLLIEREEVYDNDNDDCD